MRKKILIVEDAPSWRSFYQAAFGEVESLELFFAVNSKEAMGLVGKVAVDIVVMDGILEGDWELNQGFTDELVLEMRKVFAGPIVAASFSKDRNESLVSLGCVRSEKGFSAVDCVLKLL